MYVCLWMRVIVVCIELYMSVCRSCVILELWRICKIFPSDSSQSNDRCFKASDGQRDTDNQLS